MEKKRKMYAAYGSNMNIVQMAKRCPRAREWGIGRLEGYRFTYRGIKKGVANIEECPDNVIPIVLWEITEECEVALDQYEGFPKLYNKKRIIVKTEQGEVEAMVYVMASGYENLVALPYPNYCDIIEKGYEQHGLDKTTLHDALRNTYQEACAIKYEGNKVKE